MQDNKPLVTVITPSYNHAAYIEQAIESIANQTYKNIEYFIVDDGSTDGTHELFEELAVKHPQFTFEKHKENRGHIRLSETILKTKGKYICFLSSDDWHLPEKIEKQVEYFETLNNDWGMIHTNGCFYNQNNGTYNNYQDTNKVKKGCILKDLLEIKFSILPISPMYRREVLLEYKFLDEYKALGEGINLLIAQKYKIGYLRDSLSVMRRHNYNTGGISNIDMMLNDNLGFKNYLFNHKDFPSSLLYLKNRVLARHRYIKGWQMIRISKRYSEGRKQLILAAKLHPILLFTKPRIIIGILISLLKR